MLKIIQPEANYRNIEHPSTEISDPPLKIIRCNLIICKNFQSMQKNSHEWAVIILRKGVFYLYKNIHISDSFNKIFYSLPKPKKWIIFAPDILYFLKMMVVSRHTFFFKYLTYHTFSSQFSLMNDERCQSYSSKQVDFKVDSIYLPKFWFFLSFFFNLRKINYYVVF